jgi:hypothetical protein
MNVADADEGEEARALDEFAARQRAAEGRIHQRRLGLNVMRFFGGRVAVHALLTRRTSYQAHPR